MLEVKAAERVTMLAVKTFGRLDGLIINHGTLGNVKRIADATIEEWRMIYDINFFSAVAFVSQFEFITLISSAEA